MADEKPVENVVPRGKALRRSAKQLDEMTSPEALEALAEEAQEDWRENAPKRFKGLLDAEEKPS